MRLPIRLLAVDIDGTLLNSSFAISPRDLAALRRVHGLGVEVILVTGRRHTFAMPIASLLGFDLWLCTSNGAVTRSTAGETFHADLLAAETARRLCEYMKEFRGGTVITFDQDSRGAIVVETTDELNRHVSRWVEHNAEYIEIVSPLERCFTRDPVQAMFCGPVERMKTAEAMLDSSPVREFTTMLKTEYPHRDLSLLDILTRDCSKGHAVLRWAERRGIPRSEIMAVGDNYNDIEMLECAAFAYVMANAAPEMKSRGFALTASNDENGLSLAIEQVLGPGLLSLDSVLQR
jgi:Cof subfamily protein (haloacid dehalogenase superfamily)